MVRLRHCVYVILTSMIDIFSVASYNVLGQSFVTIQFAPYAADAPFGQAQFRHNLLIKQLACLDSSIIALQVRAGLDRCRL